MRSPARLIVRSASIGLFLAALAWPGVARAVGSHIPANNPASTHVTATLERLAQARSRIPIDVAPVRRPRLDGTVPGAAPPNALPSDAVTRRGIIRKVPLFGVVPPAAGSQERPGARSPSPGPPGVAARPPTAIYTLPKGQPVFTRALRSADPGGRQLSEVVTAIARSDGDAYDSREIVDDKLSGQLPFSAIGYLLVDLRSGARQSGTGFLIGRGVILTAAHVLHTPDNDVAVSALFEALCKVGEPGSVRLTRISQALRGQRLRVSAAWQNGDRSISADYAALFLEDARPYATCASFAIGPVEETFVRRHARLGTADFIVSGFPSDKQAGTQWMGRGPLVNSPPLTLRHMIDTFRGESGAPLLAVLADPKTSTRTVSALGIHSRASDGLENYSEARLIDKGLIADLKRWYTEMGR